MKKKISNYIYIIFCTSILMITGCDEFLETVPTNQVHNDNVFKTTELAQTVLDGTYSLLKVSSYNQKTIELRLDVVDGRDIMMNSSGGFVGDYNLGIDKTTGVLGEVSYTWNVYYNIINHANSIVAYIDGSEGSQAEKDRIKGEALALRAFSYFYLVNHFQHAWIKGKDQPGVPVYTTPADNETSGNPRGTVEDVYDRMITDLTEAINLLPDNEARLNKGYISKNTAKGLLARTYLFKEDYTNAAKYANEARTGYPLMTQEQYVSGFNDYSSPEWLWGLPVNNEESAKAQNIFSNYDLERPNGTWSIRINNKFYSYFTDTDCRAKLAVNGNYSLIIYKDQPPIGMEISSSEIIDSLVTRKLRDKADFTAHHVMMRSAEMILIEAEAEAELGGAGTAKAQNLLFEVQKRADQLAVKTTNTGQNLIDEILLERRKELYGEGLASVFDLKRKNLPLVREGNQLPGGFEAGSNRLVWQIPNMEIDANVNISESEQNPL